MELPSRNKLTIGAISAVAMLALGVVAPLAAFASSSYDNNCYCDNHDYKSYDNSCYCDNSYSYSYHHHHHHHHDDYKSYCDCDDDDYSYDNSYDNSCSCDYSSYN